ncbi:hypothetical protein [Bacillus pseudomycoides]|uniref:hypothetical protein n=1 Tax=Bacillus pseudomycoides TaxID=64104 RepID=UPI00159BC59A|nr:hypothetical protein [Bacillus pseudomycoides]
MKVITDERGRVHITQGATDFHEEYVNLKRIFEKLRYQVQTIFYTGMTEKVTIMKKEGN